MDLNRYGIRDVKELVHNPDYDTLYRDELSEGAEGFEKGYLSTLGAVNVNTGRFTGRSPKDKYIVRDEVSTDTVWWRSEQAKSSDNKPIDKKVWEKGRETAVQQLSGKKLYVMDCFAGAVERQRMKVRFITEIAWQAHFVKNMFIRPSDEELLDFEPEFTVLNAARSTFPDWEEAGIHSEVFVFFNLSEKMGLIGGSWYGGEMKKGIFSMMNYYLPLKGVAAMHCSANVGKDGETAIFFGLSGTGKTTLSTDPDRALIGDDEHGWDKQGIFNFEGGCYAKTIGLEEEAEPDIYHAIRRDALLENVILDEKGEPQFEDSSLTENTRVSYPIYHIDNIVRPVSEGGPAKKVIFLTADAYGVLPPVSFLDRDQLQYYFLSGYTSKVAGTELGIIEPQPSFSACFGAAFLTLHPTKYAKELLKRVEENDSRAYLVNTGWNGQGKRNSLKSTRKIITAILDGSIEESPCYTLPYFHLCVPEHLDGLEEGLLDPRSSFEEAEEWDLRARKLAELFIENFGQYTDADRGKRLLKAGPLL